MAKALDTLIFTPEPDVSMEAALAVLHRRGDVQELVPLEEVGLILGKATHASLEALRAIPEFRAVDLDQPVHIAQDSAD